MEEHAPSCLLEDLKHGLAWAVCALRTRALRAVGQTPAQPLPTPPAQPLAWLAAMRLAYGLAAALLCLLLQWLLGQLGALLGGALALAALEWLGAFARRGEYLLARTLLRDSGDPTYDSQRGFALYLALVALRPAILAALCWTGRCAWLVPAAALGGWAADEALAAAPLANWRNWLVPAVAALVLWPALARLTLSLTTAAALPAALLALAAAALVALLPARLDALRRLPPQTVRQIVRWTAETLLLAIGLLALRR